MSSGGPARTPSLFGDDEPEPPPRGKAAPKPAKRRTPRRGGLDPDSVKRFALVALDRPVRTRFTYAVPPELEEQLAPGCRVAVPFGPKRMLGVVVAVLPAAAVDTAELKGRLRAIERALDPGPIVDEDLLSLTRWMAEEYACAWGEALAAVLPAALKRERNRRTVVHAEAAPDIAPEVLEELETKAPKQHRLLRTLLDIDGGIELRDVLKRLNLSDAPAKGLVAKGLVKLEHVVVESDPLLTGRGDRPRHAALTGDQETAVGAITERITAGEQGAFLLQGVTGSGKTEVYLRAIEAAVEQGKGAIVLVPEIALTPQTVGWFRSRFGRVAVMHSKMTDAQRLDMWISVREGRANVVVGARSAIFAPVRNLGIVVVDEEHEPSFKQGSTPRYHARDVALRRAQVAGAVCVLGSATPSLESWRAAREGKLERLSLPVRVGGGELPPVTVVDMRTENDAEQGLFSKRLAGELRDAVARGEQAIIFQNRRGFSPVLWCRGCKETVRCERCDVSLTFHRRIQRLVCHACCEELMPPSVCPTCTKPGLAMLGSGSERLEQLVPRIAPGARVLRMDSDTMLRREDYESALDAFGRGDVDVLVGTQMIAKGLDFPNVTLVGIVGADGAMHLPDFRASERTFQLIAQVAGRAGRGEKPGRIVVQTRVPEEPAIRLAAHHDFEAFAQHEDGLRSELGYPPHGRVIRVLFDDEEELRATREAARVADALRDGLSPADAVILGPAPAPIERLRGRHRVHLVLKSPREGGGLERAREKLVELAEGVTRPRVTIDVDPVSML
jgi:primosomal protein N' (replication factor Y)